MMQIIPKINNGRQQMYLKLIPYLLLCIAE